MGSDITWTGALTAADIEALAECVGRIHARAAVLRLIDRIAVERLGAVVFSASTCRGDSLEIERVFSSRPEVYPIAARTNKRETRWGRHVLLERKVFVGEGPLEMAAAFDDQEGMSKLGVRSIVNIPIVVRDKCVGVLNFGFASDRVPAAVVSATRCLGLAGTAGYAAELLAAAEQA